MSNQNEPKKVPQDQLMLQSSNGNIDITGYQGSALTANTSSGDIRLQNIDAAFNARSENGYIHIQTQGTTTTSTDEYETRQLKGIIGTNTANSPTLTMQTQNGEINFNR